MYDLNFINLGIKISEMRNSISLFGFEIAFYGMIIAFGMVLALQVVSYDAKRRGQNHETYSDFAMYAIIFSIIGARLYYVIFSWNYYKNNLLEIFNIRAGGLAIYGAVIAGVICLYLYTKLKKKSFFEMADTAVLGLILGQSIGRFGNFFNMEAFGSYTNNIFAMQLRKSLINPSMISQNLIENLKVVDGVEYIQVHPTFLYESLWNLFVFVILFNYKKVQKFKGEIFFLYLALYGLGRFFIEGLRTDSLMLFNTSLAVSQIVALLCFILGLVVIFIKRKSFDR